MCEACGCGHYEQDTIRIGVPGETRGDDREHSHRASSEGHAPHGHIHEEAKTRTLEIHRSVFEKNDRLAERNRGFFLAKGLLVLNMLSSPGSGKTTLIERTAKALKGKLRLGVIVGDLATENDARRLQEAGLPTVQINTGSLCHLDAGMIFQALPKLPLDELDALIIENVGNLVCPADFDLGESLRVTLLSVAEGEDKPLKYPPVFHSAGAVVVAKTDLAAACGCDMERLRSNLRKIAHHARIFETSALSGEGMEAWAAYLQQACEENRQAFAPGSRG